MNKLLVVGDSISDFSRWTTATRLCPEAPAPVLIEERTETTPGGAGLVCRQVQELIGENTVSGSFGTLSRKERIFADGHLICRVDYDCIMHWPIHLKERTMNCIRSGDFKILIISDYGKGSFNPDVARKIMDAAKEKNMFVLVDAKHNWSWYPRAFAYFPNQKETENFEGDGHIIQKLGAKGCAVDGVPVLPEREHLVRDTTGAGDCFIAAFAAKLWTLLDLWDSSSEFNTNNILFLCAKFANRVAGKSVEYLGTHVVTDEVV